MESKYRFKTKYEFIAEYGEDFHYKLGYSSWNCQGNMDYLFGSKLYIDEYFIKKLENGIDIPYKGWSISLSMLKEFVPDYKPKKLVYE